MFSVASFYPDILLAKLILYAGSCIFRTTKVLLCEEIWV